MKLINNLSLGVTISAIFSIVLLITSPAVAILVMYITFSLIIIMLNQM